MSGALNWFEDRFKIRIHYEWDFKLVLPIMRIVRRKGGFKVFRTEWLDSR